jgi:hypothetical protein
MRIQLIVARRHPAKVLEAAEEPFHRVALGVAGSVVGPRSTAFTSGRNDGAGAAGSQGAHERVGIVAAVGNEVGWGPPVEQQQSLRSVMALTRRQAAAYKPASGISYHMQLASQPATAAAQGLRPVFLRAPLACWCARTVVESTSSVCNASSCCTAASTRATPPRRSSAGSACTWCASCPTRPAGPASGSRCASARARPPQSSGCPGLARRSYPPGPAAAARCAPTAHPLAKNPCANLRITVNTS